MSTPGSACTSSTSSSSRYGLSTRHERKLARGPSAPRARSQRMRTTWNWVRQIAAPSVNAEHTALSAVRAAWLHPS